MREGQRRVGGEAQRYRRRLWQEIETGARAGVQRAERWMRLSRAAHLWREATGDDPPTAWTPEDIVHALVCRAYPEQARKG